MFTTYSKLFKARVYLPPFICQRLYISLTLWLPGRNPLYRPKAGSHPSYSRDSSRRSDPTGSSKLFVIAGDFNFTYNQTNIGFILFSFFLSFFLTRWLQIICCDILNTNLKHKYTYSQNLLLKIVVVNHNIVHCNIIRLERTFHLS